MGVGVKKGHLKALARSLSRITFLQLGGLWLSDRWPVAPGHCRPLMIRSELAQLACLG